MLSKLFVLWIFVLSLSAEDILTNYRNNGIVDIEKEMDLALSKTDYWIEHLKGKDISFGYIESYNSILTCDKNLSVLSLYKKDIAKKFTLLENYSAFTGKAKGDKVREGDLKTPLGIYDIRKKISKLDSFYGPLAFVTNYPNIYDKFLGKSGSGIWVHGLPIEQERDDYTKGCIAINNENIVCLDKEIDIESTLLIINPEKNISGISKEVFASILADLYTWRYSWLYNETAKYLSFYSKEFIRYDGMKYTNFVKYKTRIFNKQEKKEIIFKDINVVPYPNTQDIFQISFKEYYASRSFTFEGNKILIVKISSDNSFKILTEK